MQLKSLIEKIDNTCNITQAQAINSVSRSLTLRNWLIGYYIVEFEQNGQDRAKYGDSLVVNIAKKLSHIKGMSTTNLKLFKMFYLAYPQISQTVSVEFKIEYQKSQTVSDKLLFVPTDNLLRACTFSHFVEYIGQMNFYLNYYKNEIVEEGDNQPIGLILCANKNHTKVEYATAGLDNTLFVSKYKIKLPSTREIEEFIEDELVEFDMNMECKK